MAVFADARRDVRRYLCVLARLLRGSMPSPATYHVTGRGVARCNIFRDDDDRRRFIWRFERVAKRYRWRSPAFTLMTNHYHLVVAADIERLSLGMQKLNGVYAQHFNEKHGRVGHLFQGRFDTWVIRDESHLARACEYVWNNPVRAGLCESADEWPWSGWFDDRSLSVMSGVRPRT